MDSLSFDNYVKQSIDSGVSPLKLVFYPVVDFEEGNAFAYRTKMVISSILMGTLKEEDYIDVTNTDICGVNLMTRTIKHIVKAYNKITEKEREIRFLSFNCPIDLWEDNSLFDTVKNALSTYPNFKPNKLVVEFSANLLEKDLEKTINLIKDMKLLKVRTAITGCGKDSFSFSKLEKIAPDMVFLDKSVVAFAGNKNKPKYLSSMISFINSMDVEAYAEGLGVYRKQMRNCDALGFYDIDCKPQTLEQVLVEDAK